MTKRTRSRVVSAALVVLVAFAGGQVFAQQQLDLSIDLTDPLQPELTWSTTPPAADCQASQSWTGAKAASGSEILPPITSSATYRIDCTWPGDTQATLSWTNPTTNTDGSPFTNPAETRLYAASDGSVPGLDAADCLIQPPAATRPPGQTVHTLTGLAPGQWQFVAFAVNTLGLCSAPSNLAAKTITGPASMSDSVSIAVPAAISGLGAQ